MAHTTTHSPRLTAAHQAVACVRAQAQTVMAVTLRHWKQPNSATPVAQR